MARPTKACASSKSGPPSPSIPTSSNTSAGMCGGIISTTLSPTAPGFAGSGSRAGPPRSSCAANTSSAITSAGTAKTTGAGPRAISTGCKSGCRWGCAGEAMEWVETIFLVLAYVAVLGFLISGLDDLFFDSHFLLYLLRHRKKPRVTLDQLKLVPEQWIAIFVPAWQEGGVVNKMAEYAARILHYEKYDLFIGVYPNDAETMGCVDQICAHNPRIHKVVVPHPGP